HLASRGGEGVSGITFGIQSGKAHNIQIGSKALDPSEKYWLITNDYLANGGDGMKTLTRAEKRIPLGIKLRDVIIGVMRERTHNGETIGASTDGRIYEIN
ncbi:MAG TPA: 5'-nucleotidase C-terminal domain-containing protein, partial [Prolixibacteraceae bacterium]|nr:5'-nucleotidase C-terminal domain-containing protein [Prolixibacteraceae bacterium]